MDKELVVGSQLTQEMCDTGRYMLEQLDINDCQVVGALWFYFSEGQEWKYIVSTPLLKSSGPKEIYRIIDRINEGSSGKTISLNSILMAQPNHPLIELLSYSFGTGEGISGVRFSNNTINGQVIEDAFIYRMKRPNTEVNATP